METQLDSNETIQSNLLMPGEWEPHQACLILYPHNPQTFRLKKAQKEVLRVARAIAHQGGETVFMLCKDHEQSKQLKEELQDDDIRIFVCPSDDTWVRDTGPTLCWNEQRNELIGLDWDFNAYGGPIEGCYWPCDKDKEIAANVCKNILNVSSYKVPMVLEGGSIHTDGEGTLLVTEECLLNRNRNPHLSKHSIEHLLKQSLGVSKIVWLPHGLDADEDTNGHVDNFCCFSKPGNVILAWTDDEKNDLENFMRCREAESLLKSITDAKGRSFQIHKLNLPPSMTYTEEEARSLANEDNESVGRQKGEKMAASYVNFYISNKAIIVPQFGLESDAEARETVQQLFPGYTVVGVHSREILIGGGNIHCITQQIPALLCAGR
eukprot:scaffold2816_cov121-Cylindrotheca_fusiformis.AAC.41